MSFACHHLFSYLVLSFLENTKSESVWPKETGALTLEGPVTVEATFLQRRSLGTQCLLVLGEHPASRASS